MRTGWKRWVVDGAAALVFVFLLGRSVVQVGTNPLYNWDTLGYMALALEWEEDDPVEVHRRVYADARDQLPNDVYQGFVNGTRRRAERAADPEAFGEHLPFHRARALFTLAIWVVHAAGVPLVTATGAVPVACFGLLGLLVLLWCARYLPFPLACLTTLGLVHVPPLMTMAGTSMADMPATLGLCAGTWLLVERRALVPAAVVLTLSVLVRLDSALYVGVLVLCMRFIESPDRRPSTRALGIWLGATVVTYLAVTRWAGDPGWWALFTNTFNPRELRPSEVGAFDAGTYWAVLKIQTSRLLGQGGYQGGARAVTGSTFVFAYLVLAGIALWSCRRLARPELDRHATVLVALLVTSLGRYVLVPQLWDRYHGALFVLVPLLFLSLVVTGLRARDRSVNEDQSAPSPT